MSLPKLISVTVTAAVVLLLGSLTSCEALKDLQLSGEAAYIFEDGSKARVVGGAEGGQAEYWRKVGDSWVRVGTEVKFKQVENEK